MTLIQRAAVATVALVSAVVAIGMLTAFSTATEGPLAGALDRLGSLLDSMEHATRERLVGPGRRRDLAWFEATRDDPTALRSPATFLFGGWDGALPGSFEGLVALERSLETTFPLIQIYTAWGDQPEHQFPVRTATSIWNLGSVPVVTWEPWLTVFDNVRHPTLPIREQRELHGMAGVARGDYDFYVDAWAAGAAAFGHPVFVRFAHEMNDPYRYPWGPQNNTKEEFIAAWRHVVDRFRRAGATNVIWVWSPHVAYDFWDLYYPGDDAVDWVATGALNFGPIAQWSRWWSFEEVFGTKYPRLMAFGKPVMVAEFGSLAVGGDRTAWYETALTDLPTRYPHVKALVFFHTTSDQTVTYQRVDWSISSDRELSKRVAAAMRKSGTAGMSGP